VEKKKKREKRKRMSLVPFFPASPAGERGGGDEATLCSNSGEKKDVLLGKMPIWTGEKRENRLHLLPSYSVLGKEGGGGGDAVFFFRVVIPYTREERGGGERVLKPREIANISYHGKKGGEKKSSHSFGDPEIVSWAPVR